MNPLRSPRRHERERSEVPARPPSARPAAPAARSSRLAFAAALVGVALLLGGCVYLRLLDLKRQLADFDRHFALQTHDGFSLICLHPVLTPSDVRWIGLHPEQVKTLGLAETWQVRWVKQLPLGIAEPAQFDLVVDLGFVENRLTRVTIPERYFAVLPKDFLLGVIKSVGRGKIDRSGKSIDTTVSSPGVAAARPRLPAIDQLLGRPSEERTEGDRTIVRYRYLPATKESRAGVFDLHLTFHTATGELLHWQGRTPVGRIGFSFPGSS